MIIRDLKKEECVHLAELDSSFMTNNIYQAQEESCGKRCIVAVDVDPPREVIPPMFGVGSPNAALRYQDQFDHYDLFIVAEQDNKFIGAACTFPLRSQLTEDTAFLAMPGELLLSSLSVDREHRKMGIGKALLDKVKSHCVERGYKLVSLWTGFDYYPAVQFYLAEGFIISGWQAPPGCRFDQCRIYMTWEP